jgi:hypothetical protein
MNDPTAVVSAVDLANLADLERAAWRHYGTACHHDSTPEQRQHLFREALAASSRIKPLITGNA